MNKEVLTDIVSSHLKLIRTEHGYTQDKMADVLGLSKKTLVQIEKGRSPAGWTVVVAVCALFRESHVLQSVLGNDPVEMVELVAHVQVRPSKQKTMGGRVWWRDLETKHGYRLQQNVISNHYRLLDPNHFRIISTFVLEEAKRRNEEDRVTPKMNDWGG